MRHVIVPVLVSLRPAECRVDRADLLSRRIHACPGEQKVLRSVLHEQGASGSTQRSDVGMIEVRVRPEGIEQGRMDGAGNVPCRREGGHPADNYGGLEPRFHHWLRRDEVTCSSSILLRYLDRALLFVGSRSQSSPRAGEVCKNSSFCRPFRRIIPVASFRIPAQSRRRGRSEITAPYRNLNNRRQATPDHCHGSLFQLSVQTGGA